MTGEAGPAGTTDDVAVVLATLEPPPGRLGVTHWSSRLLAAELGLSNVKVARVWREYGLQPGGPRPSSSPPTRSWRRSSATGGPLPEPPDKAVVLCVDEKSQVQAWTGPRRSCRCGRPAREGHA